MNFPTPSESVSTETTTETETESKTFEERSDDFETYWAVVDTERFLQKMCLNYGVAVDGKFARYTDAEGESPLADHGLFYYRQKKELAADLRGRRDDGDLPDDATLPTYTDEYPEPEYDHVVVSQENAEDFGLDADLFEDDETIFLPSEYEPETDDDGNLVVWYNSDVEYTKNDVLTALKSVDGIGDKTAGKALNALKDAGIIDL